MITHLEVKNLNHKHDFNLHFHPDLNIFTGRNGSGKTTLMKLMWYLVSGNELKIYHEIYVEEVHIKFKDIFPKPNQDPNRVFKLKIRYEDFNIKEILFKGWRGKERLQEEFSSKHVSLPKLENNENHFIISRLLRGYSIFFPTFRRIEGGFSIQYVNQKYKEYSLQNSLSLLSNFHSHFPHRLVAAISTEDIVELLNSKYAEILDQVYQLGNAQKDFILQSIEQSDNQEGDILKKIKQEVEDTEAKKAALMKPITVLSDTIRDIFADKGVKITKTLTLGDAKEAISSEQLSSGEKQMLSFLVHNAFYENAIIFIDEPEISLHVDWQRMLLPTLLKQGTNNQFFIATHSPFIYSKYPDKEHILDQDKGGK